MSINSSGVNAGVQGYAAGMSQIKSIASNTARDAALSFDQIFGANFFANLASQAVSSLTSIFTSGLASAVTYAARTEELDVALSGLAKSSNLSVASIREQQRALQDANIATQTASKVLTQYIAAGLPLEKAGPLAAVAKDLAVIAGVSSSEELERLINGITTLQVRVLRTAGVYISLAEAEKTYAKENGRTFASLTTSEKQQIALNETLKFGIRAHGLYDIAMETTAKQMRSLERVQADFTNAVGGEFVPALGVAVRAYTLFLKVFTESPGLFLTAAAGIGVFTVAIIAMNTAQIASLPIIGQVISSISTLGKVMIGTASLTSGTTATIALATAGWAALALVVVGIVGALIYYSAKQTEVKAVTKDSTDALMLQRDAVLDTKKSLESLNDTQTSQQNRMEVVKTAYQGLNVESRLRVATATDEADKIRLLTEEYDKLGIAKQKELLFSAETNALSLSEKAKEYAAIQTQANATQTTIENLKTQAQLFSSLPASRIVESSPTGEGGGSIDTTAGEKARALRAEIAQLTEQWNTLTNSQDKGAKSLYNLSDEFSNTYKTQQGLTKYLKTTNDALLEQALQTRGLGNEAQNSVAGVNSLAQSLGLLAPVSVDSTLALDKLIDKFKELDSYSEKEKNLQDQFKTVAEDIANRGLKPDDAVKLFNQRRATDKEFDDGIKKVEVYKNALKKLGETELPKEKKAPHVKSEFETLSESLRKLNGDVQSFRNLSSKEFALRFQKEELERTKRDFEQIVTLRRELALPLDSRLPDNAEGARREIDRLEQIKRLRDDILKIRNQERDAEERLIVAQIAANEAVVSARTIADTAYFEGIRKRREQEQQLTADVVAEIRKRSLYETDTLKQTQLAEADAYKDFLTTKNKETEDKLKQIAKLQFQAGQSLADNPILRSAVELAKNPTQATSPVITRLDTSNKLLQDILNAVQRSGVEGASGSFSIGNLSAKNSRGQALIKAATILGVSPADLGAVISYETGGTFNPQAIGRPTKGPAAGHIFRGLIQFDEENYSKYHVDKNRSFESQLLNSVVPYLQDRARKYGGTAGLGVEGLYKTINGGNPSVSSGASDGYGTIATHVRKIIRDHLPKSLRTFFDAVTGNNVESTVAQTPVVKTSGGSVLGAGAIAGLSQVLGLTAGVVPQQQTRGRRSELSDIAGLFGLPDGSAESLGKLSPASREAIDQYQKEKKAFAETSREQIVGMQKLAQLSDVDIKQKTELWQVEAKLSDLRGGDALTHTQVLNAAEISRGQEAVSVLTQITQKEDYLQKLRARDPEILKQIAEASKNNRLTEIIALDAEIRALEAKKGGRDAELEDLRLKKERQTVLNSVGETEANLEQQRKLNADAEYVRSRRQASITNELIDLDKKQAELNDARDANVTTARRAATVDAERIDLETRLYKIEDQRATGQANKGLRERVALEENLLAIQEAQIKIADSGTYKPEEANRKVIEFIAGQKTFTEAVADFKVGAIQTTYDYIDKGLTRITDKLGLAGSLIKDFLSSMLRLALNKVFLRLFGLDNAPVSTSGSQSSSNSTGVGSVISNLLTGGFSNGTIGGTPSFAGNQFSNGSGRTGLNFNLPFQQLIAQSQGGTSITSSSVSGSQGTGGASSSIVSSLLGGNLKDIFKGVGFGKTAGTGGAFASALPLLGATAGYSAAGGGLAGILAGAGGLALGVGLTAAPAALAAGGSLSGLGFLAPLFSNPFTAVAGAGLLVGGLILGSVLKRNKLRRAEEVQRTQILTDSKGRLQQILSDLRAGNTDSRTALASAAQIRQDYLTQVGQLTDSKTRNIAIQTVRELDYMIEDIKRAGVLADQVDNRRKLEVPTFATAGSIDYVSNRQVGINRESPYIMKRDDEVVLNRQNIANLGGYDALANAGVRGVTNSNPYTSSGRTVTYSQSVSQPASNGDAQQLFVIVADDKAADSIVSRARPGTVAKKVKIHTRQNGAESIF